MGITSPNHRADNAGRTEVALSQSGGTFQVPVIINGALRLDFVIDSGASAVSIPADVVQTLRFEREHSVTPIFWGNRRM
jgi:predicted aspartyl protease